MILGVKFGVATILRQHGAAAVAHRLEVDLLERACGSAGIPEDNSAKTGVWKGSWLESYIGGDGNVSPHSPGAGVRREWGGGERRPLVLQL